MGGCLRDLLRGKPAADWDLATSARPEQVQAAFPRVFPTGIQHGTVTVRHRGQSYEVTTLRGEGAYSDGRHPDSVQFVDSIEADLARRDFTINAMAYDPVSDRLVDPFGGLRDLDAGIIRAVGRAEERFSEDGLRVLRAARFAASLEFELAPETEAAVRPTLETFRRVSPERVREEWLKALKAQRPSRAFAIMRRTGILEVTFASLSALPPETFAWALTALDAAPRDQPIVRLAALLAPLWERRSEVSAWLKRYRFSNQEQERTLRMLEFAFIEGTEDYRDSDVRRFARAVTRGALPEVVALQQLVSEARFGVDSDRAERARKFAQRTRELIGPETPLVAKELAIGGRELMQALALPPGPQIGRLIEQLLESVLDDPGLNSQERLLELARERLTGEAQP